jgi:DNA repair exonuclease SbcCD nuclease subunit
VPLWPDYVALGHVHKPQHVKSAHVRYPGPLDRLDFGEKEDPRGVVLVDIGPDGRRSLRDIPLDPTPMHELIVTEDAVTAEELKARHPDADRALFKITVQYRAGADSRDAVDRAVRAAFGKRLVGIDWREVGGTAESGPQPISPRADLRTTVHEYLEQRLAGDPQRQALLDLVDQFMGTGAEVRS